MVQAKTTAGAAMAGRTSAVPILSGRLGSILTAWAPGACADRERKCLGTSLSPTVGVAPSQNSPWLVNASEVSPSSARETAHEMHPLPSVLPGHLRRIHGPTWVTTHVYS